MLDEGSNCLTAASATDRELLARLDAGGDEGAFEALAQRHGRMVFRVCLRLLRDWQAAEDATQAVFLILARRRSGLRAEGNLASWLHGTARQVAWCAVRGRSRRARHEGAAVRARALGAHGLSGRGEGLEDPRLALLDQELASLPVAQRQAVVLRYLEGHRVQDAARIVGCPQGTLAWRAMQGLARLRQRLVVRGGLPVVLSLCELLEAQANEVVPQSLLSSLSVVPKSAGAGAPAGTIGAGAAHLAEETMKMIFWGKLQTATLVLAFVLTGVTGALNGWSLMGGESGVPQGSLPSGIGFRELESEKEEPDLLRWVLPQESDTAETAQLLFLCLRSRKAHDGLLRLRCWDMKEDRKHWETPGIRLHDPEALDAGLETALRGAMVYGEWLFVHGRHDLIALDWRPGQEPSGRGENEPGRRIHWQFKAPEGFEILGLGRWDDLLILCGRKQTLALRVSDGGKVLWSEAEPGEYYAGPYFHRDTVLTVRRGPAEVSFRKPDSGQNLASLPLPGLTLNRRHPLFAGAAKTGAKPTAFEEETEAYPVACAEGALAVVDGRNYYLVDLERRALRWSRKIDKLDPTQANAFRLWIGLGRLWVLKPYYSVLENCVMDLASGELLWRRREGGQAVMGAAPGPGAVGRRAAGLVLHSFVFVDGLIYGGSCESPASSVRLAGLDAASGNVLLELEEKGYADPRAQVGSSWSKDCVVVRVRDGKRLELWQVDLKARRIAQRIWSEDLEGPGSGCAGRMAAQGPYLAISTGERLKFTRE